MKKEDAEKWILCKTRIPNHGNRIIVWDGMFVQEGVYRYIEKRIVVPNFKHHNEITHWREHHEPPVK